MVTGLNGIPSGVIVELYGGASAWKSTYALQLVSAAQRDGSKALYLDVDYGLTRERAVQLGVDLDRLLICHPESGEEALEVLYRLVLSGGIRIAVVDSIAALVPQSELVQQIGEVPLGLQARLMTVGIRRLVAAARKSATTVILINRLFNIDRGQGVLVPATPGGQAVRHFAGLRVRLNVGDPIISDGVCIGELIELFVTKNRYGYDGASVTHGMYFDRGYDPIEQRNELARIIGLPEPSCDLSSTWLDDDSAAAVFRTLQKKRVRREASFMDQENEADFIDFENDGPPF